MNIYLISQTKNDDYDTFDSAVVIAETEKEARGMQPSIGGCGWVDSPDDVNAEYIGVAGANQKKGVVCASFNAG